MKNQPVDLAKVRTMAADGTARSIRQAARLSLADVGAACGVDQSTVHRWEVGRRQPRGEPALKYGALLHALSRALLEGRAS